MTYLTFYEETVKFLKALLSDPIGAKPSGVLEDAGYGNSRLRKLLRERGIILMSERIEEPVDEESKKPRSMYHLSYKVRRDGFKDKMRKLFRDTYEISESNKTLTNDTMKTNQRRNTSRKPISLTEQQLNMLVETAVKEYMVNEGLWDTAKAVGQTAGKIAGGVARGVGNAVGNFAGGIKRGYQKAANTMQGYGQTFQNNQMNNNVQRLIGQINTNLNELKKYASMNPAVLGNNGSQTMMAIDNLMKQLKGASGRSQMIANS